MHVTCGSPHPGLMGLHDFTLVHDVGVQHLLSTHGSLPQVVVHGSDAPLHGSTYVPHNPAGHALAGSQHAPFLQVVLPSVLFPQLLPHWTSVPVHESVNDVQLSFVHVVSGVQQLPPVLQWVLVPSVAQVFPVQLTGTPVHGSAFMPQSSGPHVAGAQHWPAALQNVLLPSVEQLFPVQSTGTPVHGSAFMPQSPAPHVAGVQHWPVPVLQKVLVPSAVQVFPVQLTGTPVHGSAFMPQSPAPHVAGVQHSPVPVLQWVLVPSPAQVFPVQLTLPHELVFIPQSLGPHVGGAQHSPPTQVSVTVQPPHATGVPHELSCVPQAFPVHADTHVHRLFTHAWPWPPSVSQFVVPQLIESPHVFFTVPHLPSQSGFSGGAAHFVQPVRVPPHPSLTGVPSVGWQTPGLAHVSGVQHAPVSPLHLAAPVQAVGVQVMVVPHPVIDVTHLPAQSACVGGTHATH